MKIETLISDIYELFKTGVDHIDIGVSHKNDEGAKPSLRMSNLGKPLRQLFYDLTNAPNKEELSGKVRFKFQYGHILEDLVLSLAVQAGHSVEDTQREIEIDGVKGHIDAIIDGVLVDVKSCSSYSFGKFKTGAIFDDDPFGYVYQLSSYWACVGTDRAAFLAIDKVTGDLHLTELPHDRRKSESDVRSRITTVREALDRGDEPERCADLLPDGAGGNLRLPVLCSYCPHKFHCYRDSNDGHGLRAYIYSTGPKYLAKVLKEPKVPQISKDVFPTRPEEGARTEES